MENENEDIINDKMISKSENAFKIEYIGQTLKINAKFRDWKNKMLIKYGNNAKLFHCKYDNIYFYTTNNDCKSIPYYKSKCPICGRSICYYCSRYTIDNYDRGRCCIKRRIYCIFFQDGFSVIDLPFSSKDGELYFLLIIFIIPILSFILIIGYFSIVFYYKLKIKNTKDYHGHLNTYDESFKNDYLFITVTIINVLFAIVLSIPFSIIDIYFKLLILLISLPFKMYPLKYYFGIITKGLNNY